MHQRRKRSRFVDLPSTTAVLSITTLDDAKAALEAHRLRLKLRSDDLSDLAGYSHNTYPDFIVGDRIPKLVTFLDFSHALGCQVWLSPRVL